MGEGFQNYSLIKDFADDFPTSEKKRFTDHNLQMIKGPLIAFHDGIQCSRWCDATFCDETVCLYQSGIRLCLQP